MTANNRINLQIAKKERGFDGIVAVLHAWYPGQEGGTALAQLLFGESSPSGKLPVTFGRRSEENPTVHNYFPQQDDKHGEYTVPLERRAFSYYHVAKQAWSIAPGDFAILVGCSSLDIRLRGKYSLLSGEENR
jgi:hypothetical protein